MIKVGFTGTRLGMTKYQRVTLDREMLEIYHKTVDYDGWEFHHGDCIGADEQAHKIARGMGAYIHIHPPIDEKRRAFCAGATKLYDKKHFLLRNIDIVDACDLLIAIPHGPEVNRSGTWSTVRYARRKQKPYLIISPDGNMVIKGEVTYGNE